jgi:hypothetical protein
LVIVAILASVVSPVVYVTSASAGVCDRQGKRYKNEKGVWFKLVDLGNGVYASCKPW